MELRPKNENDTHSSEFLLAEFDALQQRAAANEEIKSSRVNFFLIVVAAFVAGLSTVLDKFPNYLLQITSTGSAVLLLLGLITLDQIVDYSISIVVFHQRAGRIRRWYVDNDKSIERYVPFPPNDDRPLIVINLSALVFRGADAIVMYINCVTLTLLILSFVAIIVPVFSWQWLGIAITSGVTAWYLQKAAIRFKLVRANQRRKNQIRFPYENTLSQGEPTRRGKK